MALPATGTWSNPGKGGAQADIVITAPEDGVPLLFVEIDNCFESAQVLAAKIDKYMRFGQRDGDLEFSSDPLFASAGSRSEPTEGSGERGGVRLVALRPAPDPWVMIGACCKREMNMVGVWGTRSRQR
ncbi:hypothetical protein GCM10017562_75600 [Streptomyces roseofulvus]|uniref:hypothetical protein n=1 Tax=Streptomyces roseofulvus TaxID=33902 RepID=UPI0031FA0ECB